MFISTPHDASLSMSAVHHGIQSALSNIILRYFCKDILDEVDIWNSIL